MYDWNFTGEIISDQFQHVTRIKKSVNKSEGSRMVEIGFEIGLIVKIEVRAKNFAGFQVRFVTVEGNARNANFFFSSTINRSFKRTAFSSPVKEWAR